MFRVFGLLGILLTVLIMALMWVRVADSTGVTGGDCAPGRTTTTLPPEITEGWARGVAEMVEERQDC